MGVSSSPWAGFEQILASLSSAGSMMPWRVGLTPVAWEGLRVDVLAGDGVVILRLGHKEGSPLVEVTLKLTTIIQSTFSTVRALSFSSL